MEPQTPQPVAEQPLADSGAGKGMQPGAIPDALVAALGTLPEQFSGVGDLVREHISKTSTDFTKQRQAMAESVQSKEALDKMMEDQQFRDWYSAYTEGDLAGVLRKSQSAVPAAQPAVSPDNLQNLPAHSPGEDEFGVTDDQLSVMRKEMQTLHSQNVELQNAFVTDRTERETQKFTDANPGWQEFWPNISQVKMKYPTMGLDDAYALAKSQVAAQTVSEPGAGVTTQAQAGAVQGAEPVSPSAPPLAVSASNTGGGEMPQARTIQEAGVQAATTLGFGFQEAIDNHMSQPG